MRQVEAVGARGWNIQVTGTLSIPPWEGGCRPRDPQTAITYRDGKWQKSVRMPLPPPLLDTTAESERISPTQKPSSC